MKSRVDIICDIELIIGTGSTPLLQTNEIDYIRNLEGDYQVLAIYQAALGLLVRTNTQSYTQNWLKDEIGRLGKKLAEQEVQAYNDKTAWADKYGTLTYEKVNGKIKAKLPDDVPWEPNECEKCNDTGWIANYGSNITYATKVPCSCEKGTEKAKKTDYMGPVTPIKTVQNVPKKPMYSLSSLMAQANVDYANTKANQYQDYINASQMQSAGLGFYGGLMGEGGLAGASGQGDSMIKPGISAEEEQLKTLKESLEIQKKELANEKGFFNKKKTIERLKQIDQLKDTIKQLEGIYAKSGVKSKGPIVPVGTVTTPEAPPLELPPVTGRKFRK